MKTKILSLVLLFITVSGKAQNQYHFGVLAGANLANQSIDDTVASYIFRPGFQIAFFAQFQFKHFSIEPELQVSQIGTNILFNNNKYYAKFRYLSIPVLIEYPLNEAISLMAGPQVGFLLCARSDFHPITKEPYKEQIYTSAYKKTDFGLSFGGSWASSDKLFVDLRYYLGLTDIANFAGLSATKNRSLELSVGYKILNNTK